MKTCQQIFQPCLLIYFFDFLRSVGVTAPSLSSTTSTEYIYSLANSTLANLVMENNPVVILQYCIALVHEINEQSRQVTSANTNLELGLRTKVRNAITLAAMGLPLDSMHEKEQTAFILEHLTVSCTSILNGIVVSAKKRKI